MTIKQRVKLLKDPFPRFSVKAAGNTPRSLPSVFSALLPWARAALKSALHVILDS